MGALLIIFMMIIMGEGIFAGTVSGFAGCGPEA